MCVCLVKWCFPTCAYQFGRESKSSVAYLGGNISKYGLVGVEVRRRIQAGANAWRNVYRGSNDGEKGSQKSEGEDAELR